MQTEVDVPVMIITPPMDDTVNDACIPPSNTVNDPTDPSDVPLPSHIALPNLFHSHMRRLEALKLQKTHPMKPRTRIVYSNFSPYEAYRQPVQVNTTAKLMKQLAAHHVTDMPKHPKKKKNVKHGKEDNDGGHLKPTLRGVSDEESDNKPRTRIGPQRALSTHLLKDTHASSTMLMSDTSKPSINHPTEKHEKHEKPEKHHAPSSYHTTHSRWSYLRASMHGESNRPHVKDTSPYVPVTSSHYAQGLFTLVPCFNDMGMTKRARKLAQQRGIFTHTPFKLKQLEECHKIVDAFHNKGMPISKQVVERGIVRPEELVHKNVKPVKKQRGRLFGLTAAAERATTASLQPLESILANTTIAAPLKELAELVKLKALKNKTQSNEPDTKPTTTDTAEDKVDAIDPVEETQEALPVKIPVYRQRIIRRTRKNAVGLINFQSIVVRPAGFEEDSDVRFDHRNRGTKVNSWWTAAEYRKLKKSMVSHLKVLVDERKDKLVRVELKKKKDLEETPLEKRLTHPKHAVTSSLEEFTLDPTENYETIQELHRFIKKQTQEKSYWFPSMRSTSASVVEGRSDRPSSASVALFDNHGDFMEKRGKSAGPTSMVSQPRPASALREIKEIDKFLSHKRHKTTTVASASKTTHFSTPIASKVEEFKSDWKRKVYSEFLNHELDKISERKKAFPPGQVYHDQSYRYS